MKSVKIIPFWGPSCSLLRAISLWAVLLAGGVEAAPNTNLTTVQVRAGGAHALAVRSDGTVWAWGTNGAGQLGLPSSVAFSPFPVRIAGITNAIGVAAGVYHSLAVLRDGRVFAWGTNDQGQLGNNTLISSATPVQVTNLTGAVSVSANAFHSMALLSDGTVRCWGDNSIGQLGNNNLPTDSTVPVTVSGNNVTNIVAISAGKYHSLALRGDGLLWSWGGNDDGALGNVNYPTSAIPVQVTGLSNLVAISAGWYHSLAVASNGAVWAWGYNGDGELGLGDLLGRVSATLVTSISNVAAVSGGRNGSLFLQRTGAMLVSGLAGYDFYDIGSVPLWVDRAPILNAISLGDDFAFGVTYDGSLYVMGENEYGQFGNGTLSLDVLDFAPRYSFGPFPLPASGDFARGNLESPTHKSLVIPVNQQKGIRLDQTGTNSYQYGLSRPWYTRIQTQIRYHTLGLSSGTNVGRFPVENPIAAFGSELGGTPLYLNQHYSFGAYAGGLNEALSASTNAFRILVYDRTTFAGVPTNSIVPIATNTILIPRRTVSAESNVWGSFVTNGFSATVDAFGLRTTVEFADESTNSKPWGLSWILTNGTSAVITNFILAGYKLTHIASSTSTNYHFIVEGQGAIQTGANSKDYFATNSSGAWVPVPLYSLDFEARRPLRAIFVDQPQFDGTPLPPSYAGKTVPELNGLMASVTNTIWITNSAAYTAMDNSPELRSHPALDQLVMDLERDPLKLASFVINEIDLADPIGVTQVLNGDYNPNAMSLDAGGVNRSALGTLLERQGSPVEQCALLVYLLRKAGYPAAYVWPTNKNLTMLDTRVSKLLRMQVHGSPALTSTLIPVNYPWVVLNLGGARSVQIFPWLKDTRISEGLNFYDFMPTNYNTAYKWVKDYVLGKTNILNLDSENNSPLALFPKFIAQYLETNAPGVSLDDLGVRAFNARNQFSRWEDLPLPNVLQNQDQVVVLTNLSASQPFLSNLFNTFQVRVFSGTNTSGTLVMDSGTLRMVDLNDRKFLLFTNTPTTLKLWLAGYQPATTTTLAFTNDANLTNIQQQVYTFGSQSNFTVQFIHTRFGIAGGVDFLYALQSLGVTNTRPYNVSDLAAIPINVGRVTQTMLRPHTDRYIQMERQKATNNSFLPAVEDYQGTVAYVLGMGFYERAERFQQLNLALHRTIILSEYGVGLSKLISWQPGGTRKVQGAVDMNENWMVFAANLTSRPDLGDDVGSAWENFLWMDIADGSAQEHEIINSTLEEKTAISTVRLLQLAQKRATNGNAGVLELSKTSYVSAGNSAQTGWGATLLKNQDPAIWASVTNAFSGWDGDYVRILITPGKVTNEVGSYIGMGVLIASARLAESALISGNSVPNNGGAGIWHPDFTPSAGTWELPYSETISPDGDISYHNNGTEITAGVAVLTTEQTLQLDSGSQTNAAPSVNASATQNANILNTAGFVPAVQAAENIGVVGGQADDRHGFFSTVADPVNLLTGEFYIDTADLSLPGPMALQIRRNYGSRNLADNQFGFGWKMSLMPFLTVTTNATNGVLIYAAEMDGSVVAYRKQATTDVYVVNFLDNPTLNNNTTAGIGSTANWFNARIDRYTNSSQIYYRLTGSDGSLRTFRQRSDFAVFTAGNTLTRTRPYLETWQDNRGNTLTFSFGTNSTANDYGQANRIESSSGSFLGFYYDVYGRIIEAYAGDGRRLTYTYDKLGDLTDVVLPDESQISYNYQHYYYSITNHGVITTNLDSNHLLIEEDKLDGRVLENVYDANRRVINQLSTVGQDLMLYTNATFIYNNAPDTTNFNPTLTGNTVVKDFFNNATTNYYVGSLITNITDALGRSLVQEWYPDNATAPGYPRGLKKRTDARLLTTEYKYDPTGNATNLSLSGPDLTGDGATNAVSTLSYNTNNLILESVDPSGNKVQYIYSTSYLFLPVQIVRVAGLTPISTNLMSYYNVSNVVSDGINSYTNQAFGLLQREIRGSSATNEWGYEGRGFPTNHVQYPLSSDCPSTDPIVTTTFFYNLRGELEEQTNPLGWKNRFDHDGLGRPKWRESFDQTGTALSREYFYYNATGELVWYDGPASDPEDYFYRDYDGAGRLILDIHWRVRAREDGSGVEAETGDDLYATTFYSYDGFGNLTNSIDPRGNSVAKSYDSMGQLRSEVFYGSSGTPLATNRYAYEPGGLVTFVTNALGGITTKQYTSLGKLKYQQNPDGSTNGFRYYLDGRLSTNFLSNGAYWQTSYDDANRRTTRVFFSAANARIATNSSQLDCRGNLVKSTDVEGFVSTNLFDGLDRIKLAAGPAIVTVGVAQDFSSFTNVAQQVITNFYDAGGQKLKVYNALGESTVTIFDALGRATGTGIYGSDGTMVRTNSTVYAANHHGYTTTAGSGANAIVTTILTDNDGHAIVAQHFPVFGQAFPMEFTLQTYDVVGNMTQLRECSSSNGVVTTWATNLWTFDGLNRTATETIKDGAATSFGYNSLGNLTTRTMPDGLGWSATFNNAGQMTSEKLTGGSLTSRSFSYSYYSTGNAGVGLMQTMTDGRGVAKTTTYDDFLRPFVINDSGTNNEYNLSITNKYDRRGLLTNIVQAFGSTNTGPQTRVRRSFDAYGHIFSEFTSIGSEPEQPTAQSWDSAGRRTLLYFPGAVGYALSFVSQFRADGLLTQVNDGLTWPNVFSYQDNGLLFGKSNAARVFNIGLRDGRGRVLQTTTTAHSYPALTETLSWRNDGRLSSYSALRTDFTNTARYGYSGMARRLTNESLTVAQGQQITNSYGVDFGQSGKLGIVTTAAESGAFSSTWSVPSSGGEDGLRRLSQEQTSLLERPATGRALGAAALDATLNGRPVPVQYDDGNSNGSWRANLQLSPGQNTFVVTASHPSHGYTTAATNIYTNLVSAADAWTNSFDGNGNFTVRVKRDGSNNVLATQTLLWDANDRLIKVTERDGLNSGYDWKAVYDPLGRRLRTTQTLIITNTAQPSPTVLDSTYDPQVEFLEVSVAINGEREWKIYGPDLSGRYGGMQGLGGLDAVVSDSALGFSDAGIISDQFGNVLGSADVWTGIQTWFSTRVGAYGPVAGYPALPLERDEFFYFRLAPTLTWRGLRIDPTGLYCIGARYYDPEAGRFVSADPMGFRGGSDLQGFCQGDPVNFFDADGRLAAGLNSGRQTVNSSPANSSWAFNLGYWLGGMGSSAGEGVLRGAQGEVNAISFGTMRGTLNESWESFGMANNEGDTAFGIGQGSGRVAIGALAVATGAAALEVPAIYNGAVAVGYSPWTYVAAGGVLGGASAYSEGGSPSQIAVSALATAAMTYMANPFPMGGVNAPPQEASSGSLNPQTRAAALYGTSLHADRPGNLPDQLRSMYPETQFRFTPPGVAGQDAEAVEGMHPSAYGYGNWPNGVNHGDFKPNTASGFRTFNSDQRNKWNEPTHMLPYDPNTGRLVE